MDIILGTAGHIDHGKTTLVAALTGIDCDRLKEEKQRGITIELGFAWLDTPEGRRLGIVDVPGHERFIRNMVAGASGVDCVLMVIAADEGVMPQTREHLEICSLLGASTGLIALTKTDLVDAEWLAFIKGEIRREMAGSFLENAPLIPVSASSGEGLGELRQAIFKQAGSIKKPGGSDIFRLPVDRVFSMKGFGTVATGTIASGSVRQGDRLQIYPQGGIARARSLQNHNEQVPEAFAGQRCAINLQGLDREEVSRGDVVALPDTLFPSPAWLVALEWLPSSPLPLKQRMAAHFHHGSLDTPATLTLRDAEAVPPGGTHVCEARFPQPIAGVFGDHFVIRAGSPLKTVGGGKVICPLPLRLKKRDADFDRKNEILRELSSKLSPVDTVRLVLELFPAPGLDFPKLKAATGLAGSDLEKALATLEKNGEAYCWDKATQAWISEKSLQKCLDKCVKRAEALHKAEPLKSFFAPNALCQGWGDSLPQKFSQEALSLAVRRGLLRQEGTGLKLSDHAASFTPREKETLAILAADIAKGGFSPPFLRELLEKHGWDAKKIQPLLNYLQGKGELVKIREGVYYSRPAFEQLLEKIHIWFKDNGELDVGSLKTILGVSRKYAIPILEYLDASRVTMRVGEKHQLRKN